MNTKTIYLWVYKQPLAIIDNNNIFDITASFNELNSYAHSSEKEKPNFFIESTDEAGNFQ